MELKETIKKFINSHFLKEVGLETINDDVSFLEEGVIDSVGVLELVAFIEDTFNLRVEDEELVPENLDSVNKLVAFVQSKLENKVS